MRQWTVRLPFVAADARGRLYVIDKFQAMTEDGVTIVRHPPEFRTKDGHHVTKLVSGKFVIRVGDRRIYITSDDPVAK